ncbi:hypothetical protein GQ457_12G009450 [Hibiscus cannabinus]
MTESSDFAALKSQLDGIQSSLIRLTDESHTSQWWTTQKQNLEDRLERLESTCADNQDSMSRLLRVLGSKADTILNEPEDTPPQNNTQVIPPRPLVDQGKAPMNVTVIDYYKRYSYDPTAPGLLASKPPIPSATTITIKHSPNPNFHPKLLMGENSQFQQTFTHKNPTFFTEPPHLNSSSGNQFSFLHRPKIELQSFEGTNPRGWIKRCEKYFAICNILDEHRLDMASMYLVGRAESWFDGYIMQKPRILWPEFATDLCLRFCDKASTDIIEEFNKLTQTGSVEQYQEKFEELPPFMLLHNSSLGDVYFLSSFISGLKEEIRHRIKVQQPSSLSAAFRQAKLIELSLELEAKRFK